MSAGINVPMLHCTFVQIPRGFPHARSLHQFSNHITLSFKTFSHGRKEIFQRFLPALLCSLSFSHALCKFLFMLSFNVHKSLRLNVCKVMEGENMAQHIEASFSHEANTKPHKATRETSKRVEVVHKLSSDLHINSH